MIGGSAAEISRLKTSEFRKCLHLRIKNLCVGKRANLAQPGAARVPGIFWQISELFESQPLRGSGRTWELSEFFATEVLRRFQNATLESFSVSVLEDSEGIFGRLLDVRGHFWKD